MRLAYCWFTGLGFDQEVPHHSTFSKNRHGRFQETPLFLELFERIVQHCMSVRLLKVSICQWTVRKVAPMPVPTGRSLVNNYRVNVCKKLGPQGSHALVRFAISRMRKVSRLTT